MRDEGCTGGIGLVGARPSQNGLEECDTLLMVGTSFPYMEFLPKPGQARGVQAMVDPLEPPLPAKITLSQARHFAESLIRGEPNREKIAITAVGNKVRELI